MSMAKTIQPKSDQMNNSDLLSGDRILTITRVVVREGIEDEPLDQPVSIWFNEFPEGRPYKPGLTVRRILVVAWGDDEAVYVGRRLKLYRDPEVTFGKDKPGGIRVRAMSHIPKRFAVTLATSKGKSAPYIIDVLPDDAPSSPALSETDVRIAALQTEWPDAAPERQAAIVAEVEALRAGDEFVPEPDATPGGAK